MLRFLPLLLASCVHFPSYPELVTAPKADAEATFVDVAVFDGHALLSHQDVSIADGVITAVGNTGAPVRGASIDGRGQTLMPGLVDFHVHTTLTSTPPWYLTLANPKHNLQAHVYSGVTTVIDMGGNLDELKALVDHIASDEWIGPRIFFAGQMFTERGGYPVTMIGGVYGKLAEMMLADKVTTQLSADTDIERAVRERWAAGATLVKVVVASLPAGAPRVDEAALRRIVRTAHAFGMRVAAHIDTAEDALLCAKTGVDVLAHGVETSVLSDEQARTICASGMAVVPTLVNWERFDQVVAQHFRVSTVEQESESPDILAAFADETIKQQSIPVALKPWADALVQNSATRAPNLLKLSNAGCPIFTGTDSEGSIGAFAGAIHDELRLQVAAGLTPLAVLTAATSGAAKYLQPSSAHFGEIKVGAVADLLLVRGDPTTHIEDTRNITEVFLRGRRILRYTKKSESR